MTDRALARMADTTFGLICMWPWVSHWFAFLTSITLTQESANGTFFCIHIAADLQTSRWLTDMHVNGKRTADLLYSTILLFHKSSHELFRNNSATWIRYTGRRGKKVSCYKSRVSSVLKKKRQKSKFIYIFLSVQLGRTQTHTFHTHTTHPIFQVRHWTLVGSVPLDRPPLDHMPIHSGL